MAEVAAEPVELPDDQDIPPAQGLEAGREPGPVVALARGAVLVEPAVLGLLFGLLGTALAA